ncbi:MAG: BPSS1780 family membrane protein [Propionivibrio sp.]
MQVLTLPAKRGLTWLIEGFAIFRRKPALLSFLVLGYWLSMAVVSAIPYLGQMVSFILIPVFSVSLMNACRLIDTDDELPPQILFSGFHRNLQTLLALGVVYVTASLIILGLSALFDGGLLFRMLVLGAMPDRDALADTSVFISAQLAICLLIPVMMAFWFAPVLAAWHDMTAGKSLFFSLIACARNWRPFLMYSLAVGIIGVFVPRMANALLGGEGVGQILPSLITVAISLILLPTLYASFYISYRDIFVSLRDEA